MSSGLDLSALNESGAKKVAFTVNMWGGRATQHTYAQKKDNKLAAARKFEAWLVGTKAESYRIGFVKGTQIVVQKAARTKKGKGVLSALVKAVAPAIIDAAAGAAKGKVDGMGMRKIGLGIKKVAKKKKGGKVGRPRKRKGGALYAAGYGAD